MPPSADRQQDTTVDVITTLGVWRRTHRDFVVGGNEAGMVLGGDTRAADAAVWHRAQLGAHEGKYRRVPPILAVEVQGEFEDEASLRAKANWYLSHGVEVVWLLFPESRRALVVTSDGVRGFEKESRMPEQPALSGLAPPLAQLFAQIEER